MNKRTYLVTGAAGFLGNNIVLQLLDQKETVRALVLENDPTVEKMPEGVEIYFGDITNKASLEAFFQVNDGSDMIVIHCASLVTTSPEKNQLVYDVNVKGTQNIVDLCLEKDVAKLIYISSTGAILEEAHGQVIKEPNFFFSDKVVGFYSETKAIATEYVFDAIEQHDLKATIIYPSGIAGPYDYAFGPFVSFIIRYCKGEMPIGVKGTFNAVDVRDLASTIIQAVDKGRLGQGYILSNELVDMRTMFDLISQASGARLVDTIVSADQMIDLATQGIATELVEAGKAALKFELYNLTRNNDFDNRKAKSELGFNPRPFKETIDDTVCWLKEEGKT